jgi:RND superfamily putative drug exporter
MSIDHSLDLPVDPRHGGGRLVRLAGLVRRRPLVSFFVLAYVVSWWPFALYGLTGSGPTILGCGPFLAALTVLALTSGRSGMKALFRSMRHWRVAPRWWGIAVATPISLSALATVLNVALGAPMPSTDDLATWTNVLPTALFILLVPLIGGAWEEPGWRGFALPRLLGERSALGASLVLGVLWAFWHLPVYLVDDQHWSDLVLVVLATIVFTWVFEGAGRSVLVAMVFHALNNSVSGEYFSQMFDGDDSVRQSWMLVVVWGLAAVLVVRFASGFRRSGARGAARRTRRSSRCDLRPADPRFVAYPDQGVGMKAVEPPAVAAGPTGALARLARACARHPWRTLSAWLLLIVAVAFSAATFGGKLANDITIPGSDAQKAVDLLEERFPERSGDSTQLVFYSEAGLNGSEAKQAIKEASAAAAEIEGVIAVGDPYAEKGGALSKDGTIGFVDVQFDKPGYEVEEANVVQLEDDVRAAVGDSVQVELGGAVMDSVMVDAHTSEMIGLLAAVIVLLAVLGSAVAMAIPLTLGIVSVGVGMSLLTLMAALVSVNNVTPILAVMIGLGVAIDYALFIVMRFRQGLADGESSVDAATTAVATAGRAVIFAGTTVAISISGLALIGIPFVAIMGFGTALAVVVSVLAAITLLPAVLGKLGHRIGAGKVPFVKATEDAESQSTSLVARFGRLVTGHPKTAALATLAAIATLAIPVASMELGTADAGTDPPETTTRKAYDLLAEGFGPGFNGPLLVAVDQKGEPGAADRLAAEFRSTPGVAAVVDPIANESGDTAQIPVYPKTSPQSSETADLVSTFRDGVIPSTLAGTTANAHVGGTTATNEDVASKIADKFPLFLLYVVGITFLLLTMAFRSIVVATKAALTTLLSAAAAFGALVAVFEWGWATGLVGLDNGGPTSSFLPVIVLSILFGLSMDYEVFLASRIREEFVRGGNAHRAINDGVAAVGRVIIAAALIMGSVFWAFVLTDDRVVKSFGLGLGVAILVDALIVRLILVPAIMQLLGRHAWYIPRWLDRLLPNLTIEPPHQPAVEEDEKDDEEEVSLPKAA